MMKYKLLQLTVMSTLGLALRCLFPHAVHDLEAHESTNCPFESVNWSQQDGRWNPIAAIKGSLNPYDFREDGDDGSEDLCVQLDCDKAEITGMGGHGLSINPVDQQDPLPVSSGSDFYKGSSLDYKYRLRIDDPDLLPLTLIIDWCMRSTSFLGNCPNAGGSLKVNGEATPLYDVSFSQELLEDGWIEVKDDDSQPGRPQHLQKKITLGTDNLITLDGKIDFWDSRGECQIVARVYTAGVDDGDANGEPEGGGGGDWPGWPGDDGGWALEGELLLPVVGLALPTNSELKSQDAEGNPLGDGIGDGLPDYYEMLSHGVEGDPVERKMKKSSFSAGYIDKQGQPHFPNPLRSKTVDDIFDDQQDSELDFNTFAYGRQWKGQLQKGDGFSEAFSYGGVVSAWSPFHPVSHHPIPLRPHQLAKATFENSRRGVNALYGWVKKVFVSFDSKSMRDQVIATLGDATITTTCVENIGAIPIELFPMQQYPDEADPYYQDIIEAVESELQKDESNHDLQDQESLALGGSVNFNNAAYGYPFFDVEESSVRLMDPDLTASLRFQFTDKPHDHPQEVAIPLKVGNKTPQLTDFLITDGEEAWAAVSLPIQCVRDRYQEFKKLFSNADLDWPRRRRKEYSTLRTLAATESKLGAQPPKFEHLIYAGEIDRVLDIHQKKHFFDGDVYGKYYFLQNGALESHAFGHWILVEVMKETDVFQNQDGYYTTPDRAFTMRSLTSSLQKDRGQGQKQDTAPPGGLRPGWWLIPRTYVFNYLNGRQTVPSGRYWFFELYKEEGFGRPHLYRRQQSATLDLGFGGYLSEPFSYIEPNHVKQQAQRYQKISFKAKKATQTKLELTRDADKNS